jgi:hypothetical protein
MRARRPISVQRIIVAVAARTIALVLGVASRPPIAAAQDTIPLTQCWNWANNEYRAWQGLSDSVEAVDDVLDPDGNHQRDLDMWGFTAAAANLIGNDSGNKIGGVLKSGIAYRLYANPTHADAFELKTDGSFYYSPQANYYGGDSFQYVWTATGYCSNIATVTILPFANPRFHDDTYRVDPIPPDGQVVDPLTPPAEGPSFCVRPSSQGRPSRLACRRQRPCA